MTFKTHPYFQRRWESVGRKLAYLARNRADHQAWKTETSRTLKALIGYDTMLPAPLEPRITETKAFDAYVRQRVEIQTEPGVIMPLYILIPNSSAPPYPAIIAAHGHGNSGGKLAVTGCRDQPEIADSIAKHNYDYGVQFARAGFITFCPDARGFGERQEVAAQVNILNSSCQWLNNMAFPLGQTVTSMWTWDLHRLIDYIETREDCRAGRIGCAGLSGGGLQTLWAAALDERIRCAVISGYFYGYKESLLDAHTHCSCNYVPHLYEHVDMGDIAALIAPRPLLIETGRYDPLNGASGLENVLSQVTITRAAYQTFDALEAFAHDVFEGEHRWHGLQALPWMTRHLT